MLPRLHALSVWSSSCNSSPESCYTPSFIGATTPWNSHGTRPLQLWRSCGPSVFGPLPLLQHQAVILSRVTAACTTASQTSLLNVRGDRKKSRNWTLREGEFPSPFRPFSLPFPPFTPPLEVGPIAAGGSEGAHELSSHQSVRAERGHLTYFVAFYAKICTLLIAFWCFRGVL